MMYKDEVRPLDVLIQSPSELVRRKTYLQSDDVQRCSETTEQHVNVLLLDRVVFNL